MTLLEQTLLIELEEKERQESEKMELLCQLLNVCNTLSNKLNPLSQELKTFEYELQDLGASMQKQSEALMKLSQDAEIS